MKNSRCLNLACPLRGKVSSGNIVRHGFYRTRSGKRRRYRCGECGKTFSSTKGTPYYRLQHRRATFDGVIALRVEGVSISAISRIKEIAWNTVARWLEKAAQVCRRFNHRRIAGFAAEEPVLHPFDLVDEFSDLEESEARGVQGGFLFDGVRAILGKMAVTGSLGRPLLQIAKRVLAGAVRPHCVLSRASAVSVFFRLRL